MARLHLTPDTVEAGYELLRTTMPFRRWKLPDPDDVIFRIVADRGAYATHWYDPKGHELSVSFRNVTHLDTMLRVIAHEMCHMREVQLKVPRRIGHGAVFNRLADQVCRYHHFDRGAF